MAIDWIDEMNESSSKHPKLSQDENSEPVAWVAAIVINAALVILFLSVVIYCYCKNKAKNEASRRQKLRNHILARRNWQRVPPAMKTSIFSHDQSLGYNNLFSIEEQKYHDSLEDIPTATAVPRNNTLVCSCAQHNRREQQIKRNNWIPTEIREQPSIKDNQNIRTNRTNREGIAWVDVNGKMTTPWGRTNFSFNPALSTSNVPTHHMDKLRINPNIMS